MERKAVFKTLQQGYGNEKASQLGKLRGLKSGYRSVGLWGGTAAEKNQLYWWGEYLPTPKYTLAIVSCRIKFLFSLSRAEILRSGCYYTVVGLWFLGILRPLLIPRDVRMCLYGCYAV